ncbi:32 kDa beta-galactoside-binding lectin lec-3 [Bulinus truncatus]|nr:32 kDa beta-galactoside-binding lectin lec-3 [Bulinus truncatus]
MNPISVSWFNSRVLHFRPYMPLTVPYTSTISSLLYTGRTIHICGQACSGASRFNVNFMCGPDFDKDDVVFHFDVRFKYGSYRQRVIINSRAGGQWGKNEITAKGFPFDVDSPFDIKIFLKSMKCKVSIDDIHFIDFVYPIEFSKVSHLSIQGDVMLLKVDA